MTLDWDNPILVFISRQLLGLLSIFIQTFFFPHYTSPNTTHFTILQRDAIPTVKINEISFSLEENPNFEIPLRVGYRSLEAQIHDLFLEFWQVGTNKSLILDSTQRNWNSPDSINLT